MNKKQLTLLLKYIENEINWVMGQPSHSLFMRTADKRAKLREQLFETLSKQVDTDVE
jgi:hypothetical protein